jgi:hypothetical protein
MARTHVTRVWFNRTFSSVHTVIGLIREADRDGRFHLVYSNANPHAGAARAAHQFHQEPAGMTAADYLGWCLDFCREQHIDIFVPGKEASAISGARERFQAQGARVLSVASQGMLELMHDKAAFYAGVALPRAAPPECVEFTSIAQFDAAHAQLRQRHATLCVKPSRSVYGLGFSVLDEQRSSAELLLAGTQYRIGLDDFRRGLAHLPAFRSMLLMEYLDGHEYSVDCAGDHGRLVCAVARKKPLQPGHGQLIDARQDIVEACAALAEAYGLNGIFNIQFREGQGQLRLLEINPRPSGGIGMACLAGPNLPDMALRGFADGYATLAPAAVRDGLRVGEINLPLVFE